MNERNLLDQQAIEIMAAQLAKRRFRLIVLNFLILLVPLAAGAAFLIFGKNDRQWVEATATATATDAVKKTVPPRVAQEVPPVVNQALKVNRIMERLADLEKKLGAAQMTSEGVATSEVTEPNSPGEPPKEPSDQGKRLEDMEIRLKKLEDAVKSLTQLDSERGVPALWAKVLDHERKQADQQRLLDEKIQALEGFKQGIVDQRIIERFEETETALKTLPADLRQKLDKVSNIDTRLLELENEKLAAKLGDLERQHEARKKEQADEREKIDRRIDEIEKSAFRSTLTRENDSVKISSLDFKVTTGKFVKPSSANQLTQLTVQPPSGPTITLGPSFPLDQPRPFSHKGCNFTITVRRVTEIPAWFRDYMEILIERQCRAGGKPNLP